MLSILIPTYNYNTFPLAKQITEQADTCGISFELICIDDGSNSNINTKNRKINSLKNSTFIAHNKNLGRSGIRNFLAKKANYDYLLFLDADVCLNKNDFLINYLKQIEPETKIIYGGIEYEKKRPENGKLLRWVYGIKRESIPLSKRLKKPHLAFLSLNFIIRKDVFEIVSFNEKIPNNRYEDLIFSKDLKKARIDIKHISNTVLHMGIEDSRTFLFKTNEALKSLSFIVNKGILNKNDAHITRVAYSLTFLKIAFIFEGIWFLFKRMFIKNLLSKHPLLFIFDTYRLCYYLKLKAHN